MIKRPEKITSRFPEIYRIYEEAFPKIERRTREGQRAVMEDSRYRLLICEEEGEIQAFLGYWELPSCLFLEHLATTVSCRGKGIGKQLVESCLEGTKKPAFLEIEPVVPLNPMTSRRAGFYERLGFVPSHFPYMQMPLKEGDKPCPLTIMSHGREYGEEEFLPFKREIYQIVYGIPAEECR